MSYIYLASAYSHEDAFERETRYLQACRAVAHLMKTQPLTVYSPIVMYHNVALLGGLRGDFKFWRDHNFAMLKTANKLVILRTEALDDSIGVREERIFATKHNIPWEYL